MRILMVSVFSNHFINWVSQFRGTSHEIYWLDIHDNNAYINKLEFVYQIINWKRRFDFPGREWIKLKSPALYKIIENFNSRSFKKEFEKQLNIIKPDVVQSFEMHSGCVSILKIMNKHPEIKWIYSSMGNDIYYFRRFPSKLHDIKKTLARIDFMFADCYREYKLANEYGYEGEFLGVFPTGGGYDLEFCKGLITSQKRNKIIIKGYQTRFGRCISILKALFLIHNEIKDFKIIVFSGNQKVKNYIQESKLDDLLDIQVEGSIGRVKLMELMGESLIYIGNSISDGMPNTLLEAIIMNAFPIQSNPGGATEEIIKNGKNGLLISNPEDPEEIASLIKKAIQDKEMLCNAVEYNSKIIRPKLEYNDIKAKVLASYRKIEKNQNFK